ncbi:MULTISPECIES: hypothetical protein [unclassified Mesorhizobium]|uniref:hypothetical protein n=1 Tax=unclassified Mesorhizobium TaxID=325217 RepID=UPI0016760677|nr:MULTISPECIES: hypothetical protein [unclassified Mesorhizobium]
MQQFRVAAFLQACKVTGGFLKISGRFCSQIDRNSCGGPVAIFVPVTLSGLK